MMFPLSGPDDYLSDCNDLHDSNSSETPSELEARLFSVLHYHDFTQPLPADIASEYSISFTGTEVCVTATKNSGTSNRKMTENSNFASVSVKPTSGLNCQLHDISESGKAQPSSLEKETKARGSIQLKNKSLDEESYETPCKRRKLDVKKELRDSCSSTNNIAGDEEDHRLIHNLLSKHDSSSSEEQVLFTLFNQFVTFVKKDALQNATSKSQKFMKLYKKFKALKHFNTHLCDLVKDDPFRKLFVSLKNMQHTVRRHDQDCPITKVVKKLVDETLLRLSDRSKSPTVLTDESPKNHREATISPAPKLCSNSIEEDDDDVIVISDDDDDDNRGKAGNRGAKQTKSSSKFGKNSADFCIIADFVSPSCSKSYQTSQNNSGFSINDESAITNANFSENLRNGYSSSCPPSWSKEMIDYYCNSWGGERFDHVDVLKEFKATTNPSDWRVTNHLDLIPIRKRKRGQQCNRCLQWGHLQYQCREPIKPIICLMCGGQNHIQSLCVNSKCLKCGRKSKYFAENCPTCSNSSSSKQKRCSICDSENHDHTICSDTWRSYHLTVSGDVVVPSELPMNPRQYCCNCGKAGHMDHSCPLLKKSSKVNSPFVSNYEVEKLNLFKPEPSAELDDKLFCESPNTSKNSPQNRFLGKKKKRYFTQQNLAPVVWSNKRRRR